MPAKKKTGIDRARELMAFWPLLVIIVGFVGTWYSIQNKVEAMEPVKKEVKELSTQVQAIEETTDDIQKQLEIKAVKDQAAREKINSKLDQIIKSLPNQQAPIIIEKDREVLE